jgi:hypothetical protein
MIYYIYLTTDYKITVHSVPKNVYAIRMLLFMLMGVRLCLWTAATNGPIVHPADDKVWSLSGEIILIGENRWTQRRTYPTATLATTNATWTDPGFCGERPVTNHQSHCMAHYGC